MISYMLAICVAYLIISTWRNLNVYLLFSLVENTEMSSIITEGYVRIYARLRSQEALAPGKKAEIT
jgi:hypothetical protein